MRKINKNFGWYLFDFANSIAAVLGGVYFSKWFTEGLGNSQVAFNALLISAAVSTLLLAPILGRAVDRHGTGRWFWITTSSNTFGLASLVCIAFFVEDSFLATIFSFVAFGMFMVGYQVARVCHNSYLRVMVPSEERGKVSGYGASANWLGSIFGIAISIPIVSVLPDEISRESIFALALVLYASLTCISLRLMRLDDLPAQDTAHKAKAAKFSLAVITLPVIAFFFLFDAMSTIQRNLPPFLSEAHSLPDDTQGIAFLLILVAAAVGGITSARYVNAGNSHSWIVFAGILLTLAIMLLAVGSGDLIWFAFPIAGFCYGILESSIRLAFMVNMPIHEAGQKFALLAVVERASALFGPVVWSSAFVFGFSSGTASRLAMTLMGVTVIFAILCLVFAKKPNTSEPENQL